MIAASLGAGRDSLRHRPYGNAAIALLWRNAGFLILLAALAMALFAPSWLGRQISNPFGELAGETSVVKDAVLDDTDSGANGGARLAFLPSLVLPAHLFGRYAGLISFPLSAALAPKPAAFIVPLANGPPSR